MLCQRQAGRWTAWPPSLAPDMLHTHCSHNRSTTYIFASALSSTRSVRIVITSLCSPCSPVSLFCKHPNQLPSRFPPQITMLELDSATLRACMANNVRGVERGESPMALASADARAALHASGDRPCVTAMRRRLHSAGSHRRAPLHVSTNHTRPAPPRAS
jgi:hypothetical protein